MVWASSHRPRFASASRRFRQLAGFAGWSRTAGCTALYPDTNLLSREEALRLYTGGSPWFSREEGVKGQIVAGQFADLAILSDDYFSVPAEQIRAIESVLTVTGERVVHAAAAFAEHAPPPIPVLPEWSPVGKFGGHWRVAAGESMPPFPVCCPHGLASAPLGRDGLGGAGCSCWAF